MQFAHFTHLDSTNAEAQRRAQAGMLGPIWISTDIQTKGRGRRGKDWVSQTGNLFCTGLYTFDGALADAAKLSFAAALALAETLGNYIDPALISIKWPNDVLIGGEKAAGILLESGTYEGKIWIAVGMGVNLISSPQADDYNTTHLLAHIAKDKLQGPNSVFSGTQPMITLLAERFEHWRDLYVNAGFMPLRKAWLARAQGLGRPVTARLPNKTIMGLALGMDEDGALKLKKDSGEIVKIHAGDVFFS